MQNNVPKAAKAAFFIETDVGKPEINSCVLWWCYAIMRLHRKGTRERVIMTTTAYIFTVEQFNHDRCKSTIRREIRFNTEEEAMKAFDGYDVETEFRAFLKTEGRASMEGSFLEAIVVPATTDDDGWTVYDYEEEVASKTYSWDQYTMEH